MLRQQCTHLILLFSIAACFVDCQYVQPVWFDSFKLKYAQRLKRCKFLQNGEVPTFWEECPALLNGEYSCYFGEQQCGNVTVPTKRCDCIDGLWRCDKYKHCPKNEKPSIDQCPDKHPIFNRYPFQCTMIGTVCKYDYRNCPCGENLPASLCECTTEGTFKCQFQECPLTCAKSQPPTTNPGPTAFPTRTPTAPTSYSSSGPTADPTTSAPVPTSNVTAGPIITPTSATPSASPTPSATPSAPPTPSPTSATPSAPPTPSPTSATPSAPPTPSPTSATPSSSPTPMPTSATPSSLPTPMPAPSPTSMPTPRPTTVRDAQVTLVIEFGMNTTSVDVVIKTEVVVTEEPEILLLRPFGSFLEEIYANQNYTVTIDVTKGVLYRIEIRQTGAAIKLFELCRGTSLGKNDTNLIFRDSTPSNFNGNYFIVETDSQSEIII